MLFYFFSLTSIVTLQAFFDFFGKRLDNVKELCYNKANG